MNIVASAFIASFGLMIGNFLYQALSSEYDWKKAFKISYFQALAIIGFAIYIWLTH